MFIGKLIAAGALLFAFCGVRGAAQAPAIPTCRITDAAGVVTEVTEPWLQGSVEGKSLPNTLCVPIVRSDYLQFVDLQQATKVNLSSNGTINVSLADGTSVSGRLLDSELCIKGKAELGDVSLPLSKVREFFLPKRNERPAFQAPTGHVATVADTAGLEIKIYDVRIGDAQCVERTIGEAKLVYPFVRIARIDSIQQSKGKDVLAAKLTLASAKQAEVTMPAASQLCGVTPLGDVRIRVDKVRSMRFSTPVGIVPEETKPRKPTFTALIADRTGKSATVSDVRFEAVWETDNPVGNHGWRHSSTTTVHVLPLGIGAGVTHLWFSRIAKVAVNPEVTKPIRATDWPQAEVTLRGRGKLTGYCAPFDLFQFGAISRQALVGRMEEGDYTLPLDKLSSFAFTDAQGEDQKYKVELSDNIWLDVRPPTAEGGTTAVAAWSEKTASSPSSGPSFGTATITDRDGNTTKLRDTHIGLGKAWGVSCTGPCTHWDPEWLDGQTKSLNARLGVATVTMPFNGVLRIEGGAPGTNSVVLSGTFFLSDGKEHRGAVLEPDGASFRGYKLAGVADLGAFFIDLRDIKTLVLEKKEAKPAPAFQPPEGIAGGVSDVAGQSWKVYDLSFRGFRTIPIKVGEASYDVEMSRLGAIKNLTFKDGQKYPEATLVLRSGKEIRGVLQEETNTEFRGEMELGKFSLTLDKVGAVSFYTEGKEEAKRAFQPPAGPKAVVTDRQGQKWTVYGIRFRGREVLPMKVGEANYDIEMSKVAAIKSLAFKDGQTQPETTLTLRSGKEARGVLQGEPNSEFSGETELGRFSLTLDKVGSVILETPEKPPAE